MRLLVLVASLFVLGACAHGGHHDGHKKCGENKKCGDHMAKMWEAMDKDKDQKISKKEFIDHKTEMFGEMDANKDGFVTMDEKKAHHMNKMKDKKCEKCK